MSAPPVDRSLLGTAVGIARAAGALTLKWFRQADLVVDDKADGTPVTEADRAAERLLREQIAALYPDDAIAGEEEEATAGTSGRRWIVDPIDGTKAFARGVPTYSNLLAFEDEHGPAIGVINLPALNETVYAGRGLGCFCNGAVAQVSERTDLVNAVITTSGIDGWPANALQSVLQTPARLRTWGDGWGYALVATGRAEAMIDIGVAEYDVAPMLTILPEAGGTFTDFDGRALATSGTGLGSNGRVHDEVLALLTTTRRV